jgi:threonyl-tRNA synthetase
MYAPIKIEDEEFMLRPMTCPHHFELYKSKPHSYRELPMRFAELAKLYRFEQSGELTGLIRVRSFCLADAHIVARKDQAEDEIVKVLDLIEYVAQILGFEANKDYWYRLSLGDRNDDKKYYKDDAAWDEAENVLRTVLQKRDVKSYEAPNEAAFYGPKIDFQMRNVNGKEDTAFTVQYDFVMPKRFQLKYIDVNGNEVEPIVVHRSSIGCIERIIAFLIEKYAGAFPLWLSPVQVKIIPISEKHNDYAYKLLEQLKQHNIRAEVDDGAERMQKKIRNAQLGKVYYMAVIGDKEMEGNEVNIRKRNGDQLGTMKVKEFIKQVEEQVKNRKND